MEATVEAVEPGPKTTGRARTSVRASDLVKSFMKMELSGSGCPTLAGNVLYTTAAVLNAGGHVS